MKDMKISGRGTPRHSIFVQNRLAVIDRHFCRAKTAILDTYCVYGMFDFKKTLFLSTCCVYGVLVLEKTLIVGHLPALRYVMIIALVFWCEVGAVVLRR